MVKFSCTASETALIDLIFARAQELLQNPPENKLSFHMDLDAVHSNGCPLDFAKLLVAAEINFDHDVLGIVNNIDRETGKLLNGWLPRYCLREASDTGVFRLVHGCFLNKVEYDQTKLEEVNRELLEALEAIIARIDGVFDDPSLVRYGALSPSPTEDCLAIARAAIAQAKAQK